MVQQRIYYINVVLFGLLKNDSNNDDGDDGSNPKYPKRESIEETQRHLFNIDEQINKLSDQERQKRIEQLQ